MYLRLSLFAAVCLTLSCGPERAPSPPGSSPGLKRFSVYVETTQLRREPGPEGEVIGRLEKGTVLFDLGELSDFSTSLQLQGVRFDEPWLFVRTAEGQEGWVYGGALDIAWEERSDPSDVWQDKRLRTLFGDSIAERIYAYRRLYQSMSGATDFARAYRMGMILRSELADMADNMQSDEAPPDLFWMQDAFPAFIPQRVAGGRSYYFFADYREWLRQARRTAGQADEQLVELWLSVYPEDSIEYFFPAWTFQTSNDAGHSLLGRGIHSQLLALCDQMLRQNSIFAPEIESLKADLLDDVMLPQVTYWETQEKIIAELEGILAADLRCLDRNDRIALESRLEQFRQPDLHHIALNKRAGDR